MASNTIIRRQGDLLAGRLIALPTNNDPVSNQLFSNENTATATSVDFPAMPDTIELVRSTEYAVSSNLVAPDGIHQYKSTRPLEIPVSFKLHSFDDSYCAKGALTLLQLAARLHSFTLPISTFKRQTSVAPVSGTPITTDPTTAKPVQQGNPGSAPSESAAAPSTSSTNAQVTGGGKGGIFPPVTCWLHLMYIGEQQPGISCFGYVKDVRVVFGGPWLRGVKSSFNLPTSADFSFTFVHVPGYGNAQGYGGGFTNTATDTPLSAATVQAFADDVSQNLYNTAYLVQATSYQGLDNPPTPALPPTANSTPASSTSTPSAVPPVNSGG